MTVGDPRQFQSRVLAGPGQAAATTSYPAASLPPQQPQPDAPTYNPAPIQSAYAAASVFPSDPRAAARGYAVPAQPPPPPPQQPQMDAAAKIQAIRAAIAAQTAADPSLQPQPGPAAQPRAAASAQQPQQQLGMSAAAVTSHLAAGPSDQPRPPASAGAKAASPAARPLPVAAFDLMSILQNAGVKPAVSGAPPSGSAGPNIEDKPLVMKAESGAQAIPGSSLGGPGDAGSAVEPATAVETDAQHGSKAEQNTEIRPAKPDILPDLMQLLGTMQAAAVNEGTEKAEMEQDNSAGPKM